MQPASPSAPVEYPGPPDFAFPRPPEPAPRPRFPIVAVVAPVLFAVVVYLVTGSALSILFAVLGPLIAFGTVVDSVIAQRRGSASERGRFEAELSEARLAVSRAHDRERIDLGSGALHPAQVLSEGSVDVWRTTLDRGIPVIVGTGTLRSTLSAACRDRGRSDDARVAALARDAAVLQRAPIVVDARHGVAVVGVSPLASSIGHALALQLTAQLSPDRCDLVLAGGHDGPLGWGGMLPHRVTFDDRANATALTARSRGTSGEAETLAAVVALVPELATAPRDCAIVIEVGADGVWLRRHPSLAPQRCEPVVASEAEAVLWAARARSLWARLRIVEGGAGPPAAPFSTLAARVRAVDATPARDLNCAFATDGAGAREVDLVDDGPHALVAGLTGSGKSELLTSWILAMCAARPPGGLDLLLVDFKGGAQFDSLAALPHVVGVMTDLDEATALRALASLRSEIVRRERELRRRGVRSIVELDEAGLSRLVIVVDEFAVVVERIPALHELFVDIAARGRSLGMHLILCTQRVTGVVRESLLANCPLRLCLRVSSTAESTAIISTPHAAAIAPHDRGLVYVCRSGEPPTLARVALARAADIADVAGKWAPRAQHRPWLPPLPRTLRAEALPTTAARGIPFALSDRPELQAQEVVSHDPRADGALVVLGAARSGKSTAVRTLARGWRGRAVSIPSDAASVWDALERSSSLVDGPPAAEGGTLLLLDDVDLAFADLPEEYQPAFLERLERVIRRGREFDVHTIIALTGMTRGFERVIDACEARLELRMGDASGHVRAGEKPATFVADAPPGRGRWRGHAVQVAIADSEGDRARASAGPEEWAPAGATVVVTTRPGLVADALESAFGDGLRVIAIAGLPRLEQPRLGQLVESDPTPVALVGDADCWQANWTLLTGLRSHSELVFDGCTLSEVRAIARTSAPPPPFGRYERAAWSIRPDGSMRRVRLPSAGSPAFPPSAAVPTADGG